MEIDRKYTFKSKEGDLEKNIEGSLVLLGCWNVFNILAIVSNLFLMHQQKLSAANGHANKLSDIFISEAKVGYLLFIAFTVILLVAYFKKRKSYVYLEGTHFLIKLFFLGFLVVKYNESAIFSYNITGHLVNSIVASIVILIYLFTSENPKNTFIY